MKDLFSVSDMGHFSIIGGQIQYVEVEGRRLEVEDGQVDERRRIRV